MTLRAEWLMDSELHPALRGTETYRVTKTRGKLTLEDIEESLAKAGMEGWSVILLKIGLDQYSGWGDSERPEGDQVLVTVIDEGLLCPVCKQLTPYIHYCPECGKKINLYPEED